MTKKKQPIRSDLKRVRKHVIAPHEYEEAPELTEADFARATLNIGGKPRGRPPSEHPKEHVNLRLDTDVLAHFRAGGPGWQTRINEALRRAARKKRA